MAVMAIYHFSAKMISRAAGSSALASAAYRSASRLHDERLDRHHDFSNKAGVVHSEVMLPDGAPEHLSDRETLWNEVESVEKRIDAQLAREIEFAIPRELSKEQGIELAREFVREEFVSRGMVADLNVHWDIGADGLAKPHAHVMLTTREAGENGFGKKNRDWNRTDLLEKWRALGRARQHAPRRTRYRRTGRSPLTGSAGNSAGAAAQDRPCRVADVCAGTGVRAACRACRDRTRQRRAHHRQSEHRARRDHPEPGDVHAPRLRDVRSPPQ
jgi:hypothetical protein